MIRYLCTYWTVFITIWSFSVQNMPQIIFGHQELFNCFVCCFLLLLTPDAICMMLRYDLMLRYDPTLKAKD